jgi:metal transporter CNNM
MMVGDGEVLLNCTYEASAALTDGLPSEVVCGGALYAHAETLISPGSAAFWGTVMLCVALVLTAGLMSGLTIGLVSLDANTLRVLSRTGTDAERRHAARVLPLVSRHHLLLVTLLFCNAVCMEALPIFLDRLAPAAVAVAVSVSAVLIFGEIVPQALCTRYGLAIGAACAYPVWVLIALTSPVSLPLSWLLDWMFGHSHSQFYGRSQLTELVELHETHADGNREPLTTDEVQLIRGTLALSSKRVRDYLTPWADVYALDADTVLDAASLARLRVHGHSRIPVYRGTPEQLVGVLLAKSLVGVVGAAEAGGRAPVPVGSFPLLPILTLSADTPLFDALHHFQTGRAHLACVRGRGPINGDARKVAAAARRRSTSSRSGGGGAGIGIGVGGSVDLGGNGVSGVDGDGHGSASQDSLVRLSPAASDGGGGQEDDDGPERTLGIITMEDILEELFLAAIQDETDLARGRRAPGGMRTWAPRRAGTDAAALTGQGGGAGTEARGTVSVDLGALRSKSSGSLGGPASPTAGGSGSGGAAMLRPGRVLGFQRSMSMGGPTANGDDQVLLPKP